MKQDPKTPEHQALEHAQACLAKGEQRVTAAQENVTRICAEHDASLDPDERETLRVSLATAETASARATAYRDDAKRIIERVTPTVTAQQNEAERRAEWERSAATQAAEEKAAKDRRVAELRAEIETLTTGAV